MIVVLNNKCNLEKEEFINYKKDLETLSFFEKLILCPTYLNISEAKLNNISLGAQNVSSQDNGAYTGEISAKQLKSYGVEFAIIGHSERREYQKETLEEINQKIKKLFENNITPILCIGETLEQRQNNQIEKVLREELLTAIRDLTEDQKNKLIVAYEPIWSVGTGLIPTNEEIDNIFNLIKTILPNISILYGGSVNEENIDILKQINSIDGYLLGGLSLEVEKLKIFLKKCH